MFQKIRQMMLEGLSQAEIARKLELNPKTVGRYARSNTPPQYKARDGSTRADAFMAYREKVESWVLRTPLLTDREVYELLLPEGYAGSERTVNRRMHAIRVKKDEERFFEQEYLPGEQSQFDFKEEVTLPFVGGERLCSCTSAPSRSAMHVWCADIHLRATNALSTASMSSFKRLAG